MIKSIALLYKQTTTGKTQTWEIQVEADKFRTISGQLNGKLITNEWTVCNGKNIGQSNETSPSDQALKEAEAKITKKLESGYSKSLTNVGRAKYFEPMLAAKWEDCKDKITYPIASQAKLDGIRCIVTKNGMFSRNGKPIISAPHIRESLEGLFKKHPDLIFDGELYADKFANDFNKIVSLVKKTKPTDTDLKESEKQIEYHIYDLPSSKNNFIKRMYDLGILFSTYLNLHPYCRIVETYSCNNEDEVMELYEGYVEQGYEGQILRVDAKYENKRSKSLLKHKSFIDEEFKIVDIVEGIGNRSGTAGFMSFLNKDGIPFKSNIKGSFEYLGELLKNKKALIGKLATIKYFNLTPDGIPRFPFVTSIRDYE